MESEEFPLVTDTDKARRDVQLSIARMLLRRHRDQAHAIALIELTTNPNMAGSWREILDLLDELNNGEKK